MRNVYAGEKYNMKKAVIVVGKHFSGKSKTINAFLKPKLGLGEFEHRFELKGKEGFILSQSFEESGRDVDYVIQKYANRYHYLVLASRPELESGSALKEATQKLSENGFGVSVVNIEKKEPDTYYDKKASEILKILNA